MYLTHVDYNVAQTFAELTQTSQKNTNTFLLIIVSSCERLHHITIQRVYVIDKVTTITTYCLSVRSSAYSIGKIKQSQGIYSGIGSLRIQVIKIHKKGTSCDVPLPFLPIILTFKKNSNPVFLFKLFEKLGRHQTNQVLL